MKMYFEGYGMLEWLEPADYYASDWTYKGFLDGADGVEYDIVFSRSTQEFRYTHI